MPSLAKPTIRVAFQGERGAYSEEAARTLLGPEAEAVPHRAFEEVFEAVAKDGAHCAAEPIEHSLARSVHKKYCQVVQECLPIPGEGHVKILDHPFTPSAVVLEPGA